MSASPMKTLKHMIKKIMWAITGLVLMLCADCADDVSNQHKTIHKREKRGLRYQFGCSLFRLCVPFLEANITSAIFELRVFHFNKLKN